MGRQAASGLVFCILQHNIIYWQGLQTICGLSQHLVKLPQGVSHAR